MRLGQLLVTQGLIRGDQLETALREQARSRRFLGDVLLALGFIKESELYPILAQSLGYPYLDLATQTQARFHLGGWVEIDTDTRLKLACCDPQDVFVRHKWRQTYGRDPDEVFLISPKQQAAISVPQQSSAENAPGLFKSIMTQAIAARASDVHVIPGQHHCQIYLRIDGIMTPLQTIHKEQWLSLCAHIKVLGQLDLAENRRPQDGAFRLHHASNPIDCRLSILPTKDGESLVIRLLDPKSIILDLAQLGLQPHQQRDLEHIARCPSGLFVITGPTGSGKTTTLYAILSAMAGQGRNIMTVEQPVEYRLDEIRQTEIQSDVISFADALRAILRHDPDVIYISEIRDTETAITAVRAAMTGHLVLTTLHVNDVRLISRRLEDLGVPANYLKGILLGGMAQRLVRRNCCLDGCETCFGTGFKGRHIIAEVFAQGDDLQQQYLSRPLERLYHSANQLVVQGITNQLEVERVLGKVELANVA